MLSLVRILLLLILVLISVAFLTVLERKYMSGIQRRRGPNIVGLYGTLQAIGDGLKLVVKESILPTAADKRIYWISPCISFVCSLMCWSVMPMSEGVILSMMGVGVNVLMVLGISSIGVYGVILGGWSSNSKYGILGGLRSTGQMISYEVSIGFYVGMVMLYNGGVGSIEELVLSQEGSILRWNMIGMIWVWLVFVILIVAETNRHPFDLPEAEAELVSGYNVEYSGGSFALYFLGEYSSIILMSTLSVMLFQGGYNIYNELDSSIFRILGILSSSMKVFIILCVFIWLRAGYPRYRFDQLIELGWTYYLCIGLGSLIWLIGIIFVLG